MKRKTATPSRKPQDAPGRAHVNLEQKHRAFALAYLANGHNAGRAYLYVHPGITSPAAWTGGWEWLRRPEVQGFIRVELQKAWGNLEMAAQEALGRLALMARATLDMALDEEGNLLEPACWPPELKEAAKSWERKSGKVVLGDKLAALRVVLELAGKLRNPVSESVDLLAAALVEDRERRKQEQASRKG